MKINRTMGIAIGFVFCAATMVSAAVPLMLPRPDGKPGDTGKPVKVYILAGQSNMVGMGDLTGARPQYVRVFYSANPATIPGATTISRNERGRVTDELAVDRHGLYDAKVEQNTLTAQIDVPVTGNFWIRAGHAASITINGQPVTEKIMLEAGTRYSIKIASTTGDPRVFWLERVDIPAHGDLVTITKRDGKFPYLIDDDGKWTARSDVTYIDPRLFPNRASSPLSATANNGKSIGPELGFGSVMGTFHDEQVLIIKTAMGNRSLGFDFRPPSSGRTAPDNQYEAFEFRAMVEGVRNTLDKIDTVVPGYAGQGYEIAGFGWFQGHKDSGASKEEYEKHLVNLIHDLRRDLNAPRMPAVIATVGFHGYRVNTGSWKGVWEAQMALDDAGQYPDFAGKVASVDTRDFWRDIEASPTSQDYHYNRNAETFMLIGEAMGRAMVQLVGGKAEAIPKSDREARFAAAIAETATNPTPTNEQRAAHQMAIRPMILEGLLTAFLENPRNQSAVQAALKAEKPARMSPFLNDILDNVVEYYQAAGISDYNWRPVGDNLIYETWDYFGFDLPGHPNRIRTVAANPAADEADAKDMPRATTGKGGATALNITLPAGMENWFAPEFDPRKAGWKSGTAPFGESAENVTLPEWASGYRTRRQPKTVMDNDVLLLRQTLDLPPMKDGYRYRIRVHGSVHNNMGGSYAIYVNGTLLIENREGVLAWRRQGRLPRGVHVYPEFRELFQGDKLTIAVSNFAMENFSPDRFIPPGAPLRVWIEEQKIPPLAWLIHKLRRESCQCA